MTQLPTLRRELVAASAVLFTGALVVAIAGVVLVVPRLQPAAASAYVVLLLAADVALFAVLGAFLLHRRLLRPLDRLVGGVEAMSGGDLGAAMPAPETAEIARVVSAVESMGARLLAEQQALAGNIQSLDETNRLLTEARDAMVRAEKMASVGRLGSGIAHEVGNPLGAIIGYLGILARRVDGQEREMVDAAAREAHRIDRIVRGLLDYARPRDAVAQSIDVAAVLVDTIDLVRTQGGFAHAELVTELGDVALNVHGDPYQLQQVFVNLLVNAADALEGRSDARIEVTARRRRILRPLLRTPARRKEDPPGIDYSHRRRLAATPRLPDGDPASASGYIVEVTVTDNGPGLAPDMVEQVFEPFVTTKEPGKGTGLGLAVCARLIDSMDGHIRAENSAGGGAVFRVVLPALPEE